MSLAEVPLGWFAAAAVLALAWLWRFPLPRESNAAPPAGSDLAGVALLALVATHLLRLAAGVVARGAEDPTPRLLGYVPLLLNIALLLWLGCGRFRGVLGAWPKWRVLVDGVALYALFFPLVLASHWCSDELLRDAQLPRQETLRWLESTPGWGHGIVIAALIVVVPLSEELIFRGFLLRGLEQLARPRCGTAARGVALVISAALFAGVHERFAMIPVFVVGILLGAMTQRTGGLWTAVVFHALHNAVTIFWSAKP